MTATNLTTNCIKFADYSTVLFMDTMVALEAKPLAALPWHEVDPLGPILILVVPQVNAEIDKRKRDGRLGKRAREFNRLIGPAAESASATRICHGSPAVDIAVAVCDRVDWDALDEFEPESGDARVVAQILHTRGVPFEQRILFTHDSNPIALASRRGLRVKRLPDHWLQEPEPSPQEKEITRLKSRVKELESTEPELVPDIKFGLEAPPQVYEVVPLSDRQQEALVELVLSKNPKKEQRTSDIFGGFDYDAGFDRRYDVYKRRSLPKYASAVHERIQAHYCQVPFSLTLKNTGHVPAKNLILRLDAIGGTIGSRFLCYSLFGPTAPRPKLYDPLSHIRNFEFPRNSQPVGRHDMEFAVGPDRGASIEVHCADFRHGRTWELEGTAVIDPCSSSPFKLIVEITAANLRGAVKGVEGLEWIAKKATPGDLLDFGARKHLVKIPMADEFQHALQTENWQWFEFVKDEDDD